MPSMVTTHHQGNNKTCARSREDLDPVVIGPRKVVPSRTVLSYPTFPSCWTRRLATAMDAKNINNILTVPCLPTRQKEIWRDEPCRTVPHIPTRPSHTPISPPPRGIRPRLFRRLVEPALRGIVRCRMYQPAARKDGVCASASLHTWGRRRACRLVWPAGQPQPRHALNLPRHPGTASTGTRSACTTPSTHTMTSLVSCFTLFCLFSARNRKMFRSAARPLGFRIRLPYYLSASPDFLHNKLRDCVKF